MTVKRKRITEKELVDPGSIVNALPRTTLRAWGFDPDGDLVCWVDPRTGDRIIEQDIGGEGS